MSATAFLAPSTSTSSSSSGAAVMLGEKDLPPLPLFSPANNFAAYPLFSEQSTSKTTASSRIVPAPAPAPAPSQTKAPLFPPRKQSLPNNNPLQATSNPVPPHLENSTPAARFKASNHHHYHHHGSSNHSHVRSESVSHHHHNHPPVSYYSRQRSGSTSRLPPHSLPTVAPLTAAAGPPPKVSTFQLAPPPPPPPLPTAHPSSSSFSHSVAAGPTKPILPRLQTAPADLHQRRPSLAGSQQQQEDVLIIQKPRFNIPRKKIVAPAPPPPPPPGFGPLPSARYNRTPPPAQSVPGLARSSTTTLSSFDGPSAAERGNNYGAGLQVPGRFQTPSPFQSAAALVPPPPPPPLAPAPAPGPAYSRKRSASVAHIQPASLKVINSAAVKAEHGHIRSISATSAAMMMGNVNNSNNNAGSSSQMSRAHMNQPTAAPAPPPRLNFIHPAPFYADSSAAMDVDDSAESPSPRTRSIAKVSQWDYMQDPSDSRSELCQSRSSNGDNFCLEVRHNENIRGTGMEIAVPPPGHGDTVTNISPLAHEAPEKCGVIGIRLDHPYDNFNQARKVARHHTPDSSRGAKGNGATPPPPSVQEASKNRPEVTKRGLVRAESKKGTPAERLATIENEISIISPLASVELAGRQVQAVATPRSKFESFRLVPAMQGATTQGDIMLQMVPDSPALDDDDESSLLGEFNKMVTSSFPTPPDSRGATSARPALQRSNSNKMAAGGDSSKPGSKKGSPPMSNKEFFEKLERQESSQTANGGGGGGRPSTSTSAGRPSSSCKGNSNSNNLNSSNSSTDALVAGEKHAKSSKNPSQLWNKMITRIGSKREQKPLRFLEDQVGLTPAQMERMAEEEREEWLRKLRDDVKQKGISNISGPIGSDDPPNSPILASPMYLSPRDPVSPPIGVLPSSPIRDNFPTYPTIPPPSPPLQPQPQPQPQHQPQQKHVPPPLTLVIPDKKFAEDMAPPLQSSFSVDTSTDSSCTVAPATTPNIVTRLKSFRRNISVRKNSREPPSALKTVRETNADLMSPTGGGMLLMTSPKGTQHRLKPRKVTSPTTTECKECGRGPVGFPTPPHHQHPPIIYVPMVPAQHTHMDPNFPPRTPIVPTFPSTPTHLHTQFPRTPPRPYRPYEEPPSLSLSPPSTPRTPFTPTRPAPKPPHMHLFPHTPTRAVHFPDDRDVEDDLAMGMAMGMDLNMELTRF